MKKIIIVICLIVFGYIATAQENNTHESFKNDSTYVDTLNRNLIGINVYPAFGILGGGRLPSTKIFIQYKHMFDNLNLRTSVNYINFFKNYESIDIIRITTDTVLTDNGPEARDSLVFRKFYYDIYSYDFRVGLEAAFPNKDWRFYIGAGLIGGYHFTGEYYYHYKKAFNGYPVEYVNIFPLVAETVGYRKTSFFKAGMDFTVGVDINISPNAVVSIQYAPELVYYHQIKQDVLDPDNYYIRPLNNGLNFIPDYIDIMVSIRF